MSLGLQGFSAVGIDVLGFFDAEAGLGFRVTILSVDLVCLSLPISVDAHG